MLTDQDVRRFQENGFLLGGRMLDDAAVDELRGEVERVIRDKDRPVPQPVLLHNFAKAPGQVVWQIVNIWMASPAFARLVRQPTIVEEIAQLSAAREVRLWHDQIQFKPAATGGVNMWHQDWPYWPILDTPHQVTAWVALDDVDEDNGCMRMVPGSQRWGDTSEFLHTLTEFTALPPEYNQQRVTIVPCPVRNGHVHYHHSLTWHGSPANRSGRPRRAIALHYMTEQTRYQAAGTHVLQPFVKVPAGAQLAGEYFPRVWPEPGAGRMFSQ